MYTAITDHREPCRMKLICEGKTERVIGLHGIGYGVDEMIQGFAVAINMGATKPISTIRLRFTQQDPKNLLQ